MLEAAVEQVLWCSPCPWAIQILQLMLWKMDAAVGTSCHLFSMCPPSPAAFMPPSHLCSSPSQLSHPALSLNPCHQIFKWSFPSQISRTVLYPASLSSLSTFLESKLYSFLEGPVLHVTLSCKSEPFPVSAPSFSVTCYLVFVKRLFLQILLCFLGLSHNSSFSLHLG